MKRPTTLSQLVGELHQIIAEHGDKRVVSIATTNDGHFEFWLADLQFILDKGGFDDTTKHRVTYLQD